MRKCLVFLFMLSAMQTYAQQRDWNALMRFPNKQEIANYNKTSKSRSPYLCAWYNTGVVGKFNEISVDFKADYVPSGTYCSLANFYLDYEDQLTQYERIELDNIAGYAGFQRNAVNPNRYNGILSFWDVYCWYKNGMKTTMRAKRIWPEGKVADDSFGHEGEGAHHLQDYPWKAGRWYRMLLQCGRSELTGNTTIEQWFCDLGTKTWTKLCVYDLGAPNLSFKGNMAVFLENFQVETSGEVRTMEVRNVRVRCAATNEWVDVESANISQNFNLFGSYQYGADDNTVWMITTGVPGVAPRDGTKWVKVKNLESGKPY